MRSLALVAVFAASLFLNLGSGSAEAQVYPPPINTPPPGYSPAPPPGPPAGPPPRADYGRYDGGHHYRRYRVRYDRHYRRYYRYRRYAYAGCHRRNGRIGAVAGAVGGGIIGAAITHGNPAFTMIGAGAGALTGHALGRSSGC